MQEAARLCPGARRLRVWCDAYAAEDWPSTADPQEGARLIDLAALAQLPALAELEVRDCFMSDDALAAALAAAPLRIVRISSEGLMAPRVRGARLEELALASGSMTELRVDSCPALRFLRVEGREQASLPLAVAACPLLERLHVEGPTCEASLAGVPGLREVRVERFGAGLLARLPPSLETLELGLDSDAPWGDEGPAARPALPAAALWVALSSLPRLRSLRLYGLRLPDAELHVRHAALEHLHLAMCRWPPAPPLPPRLALDCPRLVALHVALPPEPGTPPLPRASVAPAPALRHAFFARCPFLTDAWLADFCASHGALALLSLRACEALRGVEFAGPAPPLRALEVHRAPRFGPAALRALLAAGLPLRALAATACAGLAGRLRLALPASVRRLDLQESAALGALEVTAAPGLEELAAGGCPRLRSLAAPRAACPRLARLELAESPALETLLL
eukprot:tig00001299_g8065.t1